MRLPLLRFTVRRMMVVIATLAVSWAMLNGIASLRIYRSNLEWERYHREVSATLEAEKKANLAAEWRKGIEESARRNQEMNQETLSNVVTLSVLVGLGIILGGLGLVLRMRYGSVSSARPTLVNALAAVCSAGTQILFAGLILGGVAYVGLMVLVQVWDD